MGSYWRENVKAKEYARLEGSADFDVAVIGGGITGICTAYFLAKAGVPCCLIEKGVIAENETSYTTAFLNYAIDYSFSELTENYGKKVAGQVWRSVKHAVDLIESISRSEKISCDFKRCDLSFLPTKMRDLKKLKNEEALAKGTGLPAEIMKKDEGMFVKQFLRFSDNAKFHPLKFVFGLGLKAEELGCSIYQNTPAVSYNTDNENFLIKTSRGQIKSKYLVLATHNPIGKIVEVQSRIIPFQTYVIQGKIKSQIKEGLYIDTSSPYYYLRIDEDGEEKNFLFGGRDHRTGEVPKTNPYKELRKKLSVFAPRSQFNVEREWSGQIINSMDGLPFIGRLPLNDNIFIATGFAGDGMTFGILSAKIITDLITTGNNSYAKLYTLARIKKIKKIIEGQVFVAKKLIGKNLQKKKSTHKTCTHLGCELQWNSLDKTWDCPCHGSRFQKDGSVQNGPATKPFKDLK